MADPSPSATAAAAAKPASTFPATSLYVGDLDPDVTEAQLMDKFNTVGSVTLVRICRDKITRQSLGYAYVNFSQPSEAERALDTMNFECINNRPMRIMWSQRDPALRRSGIGNVFIKNLDKSIDNKSLYDTFSTFGNIISCKIMSDDRGSKGYGFVHFETQEAAENAIKNVNNMLLNGKIVYVSHFIPKSSRGSGEGEGSAAAKFTNVYVKNLDEGVDTDEKLKAMFAEFGEVTSAKVALTKEGRPAGFGFVNFSKPDEAVKAIEKLNDSELNGKKLFVGKFEKKSDRLSNLRRQYEERKLEKLKKYYGINLFVKNLDDRVDSERLKKDFSAFGNITSAKVMTENGRSKGFGFVCFTTPEEANRAISEMNGRIVGSKPLYIALAQRKEDRRKILTAQFRERLQTSQYLLQQQQQQQAVVSQQQALSQAGMFQPYQSVPRFMGAAAGGLMVGSGQGPFQRGAAVPRWPLINQTANNPYQQQQQPRAYPQQQIAAAQQPPYFMQPNQQGFNKNANNYGGNNRYPRDINNNKFANYALPVRAAPMTGPEPLNSGILAAADPKQQKQMIGERLYPLVAKLQPELAGKITGMLLEIDNSELLHMLESGESLKSRVDEAIFVLKTHQGKPAPGVQYQKV